MFSHFIIEVIVFYLTVISLLCTGHSCGRNTRKRDLVKLESI